MEFSRLVQWVASKIPSGIKCSEVSDFADGTLLCHLYTAVTGREVKGALRKEGGKQQTVAHDVERTDAVLRAFMDDGVSISCSGLDFHSGNETLIAGVLWRIMLKYDHIPDQQVERWKEGLAAIHNKSPSSPAAGVAPVATEAVAAGVAAVATEAVAAAVATEAAVPPADPGLVSPLARDKVDDRDAVGSVSASLVSVQLDELSLRELDEFIAGQRSEEAKGSADSPVDLFKSPPAPMGGEAAGKEGRGTLSLLSGALISGEPGGGANGTLPPIFSASSLPSGSVDAAPAGAVCDLISIGPRREDKSSNEGSGHSPAAAPVPLAAPSPPKNISGGCAAAVEHDDPSSPQSPASVDRMPPFVPGVVPAGVDVGEPAPTAPPLDFGPPSETYAAAAPAAVGQVFHSPYGMQPPYPMPPQNQYVPYPPAHPGYPPPAADAAPPAAYPPPYQTGNGWTSYPNPQPPVYAAATPQAPYPTHLPNYSTPYPPVAPQFAPPYASSPGHIAPPPPGPSYGFANVTMDVVPPPPTQQYQSQQGYPPSAYPPPSPASQPPYAQPSTSMAPIYHPPPPAYSTPAAAAAMPNGYVTPHGLPVPAVSSPYTYSPPPWAGPAFDSSRGR